MKTTSTLIGTALLLTAGVAGTVLAGERIRLKPVSGSEAAVVKVDRPVVISQSSVVPEPLKVPEMKEPGVTRELNLLEEDFNNVPAGETETIETLGERYVRVHRKPLFRARPLCRSRIHARERNLGRRLGICREKRFRRASGLQSLYERVHQFPARRICRRPHSEGTRTLRQRLSGAPTTSSATTTTHGSSFNCNGMFVGGYDDKQDSL